MQHAQSSLPDDAHACVHFMVTFLKYLHCKMNLVVVSKMKRSAVQTHMRKCQVSFNEQKCKHWSINRFNDSETVQSVKECCNVTIKIVRIFFCDNHHNYLSLSLIHTYLLSLSHRHTYTHRHSYPHTLTLSFSHSSTHTYSLFLSHTHRDTHPHTLTLSLTHTHTHILPPSISLHS